MNILGISAFNHEPACCLLHGSRLIAGAVFLTGGHSDLDAVDARDVFTGILSTETVIRKTFRHPYRWYLDVDIHPEFVYTPPITIHSPSKWM